MFKVLWSLGLFAALIVPTTNKGCASNPNPANADQLKGAQFITMVGTVRHISDKVEGNFTDITVEADDGNVVVVRACGQSEPRVWETMHVQLTFAQANETDEFYWPCYTVTDVKKVENKPAFVQQNTPWQPPSSSVPY